MRPAAAGHVAMFLFTSLASGSFALGALAANEIAPTALNAVRFAIASGLVGVVTVATTGVPRQVLHAPWRFFVLAGFFVIYFVLMFEGLKTAAPVSAAAVFTLTPIMAAGFGWILLRQKLTARMALALAIGGAGALWVIFRADFAALRRFEVGTGEMVFFVGCVSHALYIPLVRKLNRGEPAMVQTFGMLLAGTLLLWVYGWSDIRATDWANLPTVVWVTIMYTAVFASAVTFVLVQFAAMRLPSSKVMAYTYLVPSWVIVWQMALGAPPPPAMIFAGVALTVVALGMLLRE